MDLVGPFRPVKKRIQLEPESERADEDFKKARRSGRSAVKPRRSFIAFETVNKQKEAIKSLLSEGNTDRALKYVNDLVEYQRARSEIKDLVKSLCDLAQHAKSIGDSKIQLSLAQRAVKMLPSDGWSQAQLGDAFLCLGQYKNALKAYGDACNHGEKAVGLHGRAEAFKAMGRLDEALKEYERSIQEFPHDPVGRSGRAEVLKALGRLDEALAEYNQAVQDFPHEVVPRDGRTEVLKALGQLEEALGVYDQVLKEFPSDVFARNGRASVLALLGRYGEALELLPSESPTTFQDWVAFHIRGMVLLKQGDLDTAIEIFERGTRENPWITDRKYFRTALAVARLRQKEYQEAVQVIGDEPTPVCQVLRIHAFGGLGDIEKAKNAFDRVKDSRLPKVVSLRDELAARYVLQVETSEQRSDDWVFQQECDLLLAA